MGTGIVAVLMKSVPFHTPVLYYLSIVFFLLNVLIFALASITSILRYTLYPGIWRVMIQDPTNSLFLATIPMGFATLIEMWIFICVPLWGEWAISFAWALWIVDVVAAASATLSLSFVLSVFVFHPQVNDVLTIRAQNLSTLYHLSGSNHRTPIVARRGDDCRGGRRRRGSAHSTQPTACIGDSPGLFHSLGHGHSSGNRRVGDLLPATGGS